MKRKTKSLDYDTATRLVSELTTSIENASRRYESTDTINYAYMTGALLSVPKSVVTSDDVGTQLVKEAQWFNEGLL